MFKWKLLLVNILLILILGQWKTDQAQACTGGRTDINNLLGMDNMVIVLGQFIDLDDTNRNGLFQVKQYLGRNVASEYLMVSEVSADQLERMYAGGDVGCDILGNVFESFTDTVLFLRHNDDGSYTTLTPAMVLDFHNSESTQEIYYTRGESNELITEIVNLDTLLALIEDLTEHPPLLPVTEAVMPLPAPLLIMTENNTAYMLPLDGGEPILLLENVDIYQASGNRLLFISGDKVYLQFRNYLQPLTSPAFNLIDCPQQDCIGFSPKGVFSANFIPGGSLSIQDRRSPLANATSTTDVYLPIVIDAPVYHFEFSPQENFLAIWRESVIEIYTVNPPEYPERISFSLFNQTGYSRENSNLSSIWSNDENFLAFVDGDGAWVWKVADINGDKQLVTSEESDSLTVEGFSANGNYLQVTNTQGKHTIRLATGEKLPWGIISPDERWIAIPQNVETGRSEMCDLLLNKCLRTSVYFQEFIWLNEEQVFVWASGQPATRLFGDTPGIFELYSEYCNLPSTSTS